MTTTVTTTGITFNDATTQTTAAAASIPSGSVVLFYQASAPTGWTQVTTLNDYDLRLVSGTGGTTAGTTAYSTVFANQTPTITTSGLSAGATTLSTAQMPSHTHTFNVGTSNTGLGGGTYGSYGGNCVANQCTNSLYGSFANQISAAGSSSSHTHSISGSATSSAITLNVRYANIIICSKN